MNLISPLRLAAIVTLATVLTGTVAWLGAAPQRVPAPKAQPQLKGTARVAPTSTLKSPLLQTSDEVVQTPAIGPLGATASKLMNFRAAIHSNDPEGAIKAITAFLLSNENDATGETFGLGLNGSLAGAPTLRIAALDALGQLCRRTGSSKAAQLGRTIMDKSTSADEWAVCLRNIAWTEPQARDYLVRQTGKLMNNSEWLAHPTNGWFEAFDVAVHTQATELMPTLAAMRIQDARPDLAHASMIAIDRLAAAAPAATMNLLNATPGMLGQLPGVRADVFAKADLTQPAQRSAMEHYLARTDASVTEKADALAGLLSPGTFISNNLLTSTPPTPELEQAATRINALGDVVEDWQRSGQFPELASAMNTFIQQSNAIATELAAVR